MNQKTKICKHCQSEIPKKAKVCPNCRKKQGGKLKWIVISVVLIAIIAAVAGGGDGESESKAASSEQEAQADAPKKEKKEEKKEAKEPEPTPEDDGIINVDISECHVQYIKHEIVENLSGEKCLAVYYEFTNNSDEGKMFYVTVSDKAFQNGVELETSTFHVNDESKNSSAEIKPGVTLTVCSGFVLRDEETDVNLEVSKLITLSDTPDDTMVLSIK